MLGRNILRSLTRRGEYNAPKGGLFKMSLVDRSLLGLTQDESEKYLSAINIIGSLNNLYGDGRLRNQVQMGVIRDIQAQRMLPNVPVPSRRNVLKYLDTVHQNTGSLQLAVRSWLSSGSWTSSGGSFKLAEDAGYDLAEDIVEDFTEPTVLEVGAGYAGFLAYPGENQGLAKMYLARRFLDKETGEETKLHFTNLTEWFKDLDLPEGVTEHPGILARNVSSLHDKIGTVDIVYSQCAAYFDDKIEDFVSGAASMLSQGGYFIFNAPENKSDDVMQNAEGLVLENKVALGGSNGDLYCFRRFPK